MADSRTGNFPHFLIKEIHEQPAAVRDTVLAHWDAASGQISFRGKTIDSRELRELTRINIAASGSSRHAGMAGRTMIHELARVPVEVDYASEFEHRSVPAIGELTIVITQSGETADTLSALRKAKALGSRTLALTNVVDSTIAREADAVIYTHAGPEISVAATKTFTTQLVAVFLFAVHLAQCRGALDSNGAGALVAELLALPEKIEAALTCDGESRKLAQLYHRQEGFLFLGHGVHYPVAMDGALKLKEVSYIHAEGYPIGEIRHGPYALIEKGLPVVVLASHSERAQGAPAWEKTLATMREIRQHGARLVAVAARDEDEFGAAADHVFWIPSAPELLLPVLEIVPLQLLAYHIAVARGCDVDHPRNLVKAVTE